MQKGRTPGRGSSVGRRPRVEVAVAAYFSDVVRAGILRVLAL